MISQDSIYHKFYQLIPNTVRLRLTFCVFFLGILGLLEMFSLTALLAFFASIEGSSNVGRMQSIPGFESLVSVADYKWLLLTVIFFFIVKSIITYLVTRFSYRLAVSTKVYFQNALFHKFLFMPFGKLASTNSSVMVRSITSDCNSLEGRFLMPVLILLGESIPTIFICALLAFMNIQAFLASFSLLGILGYMTYLLTYPKMLQAGKDQQLADGRVVECVLQAYQGFSELTVYDLKGWARQKFNGWTKASGDAIVGALSLGLLPRLVFEIGIFSLLGVMFLIYSYDNRSPTEMIGELAVFGAAAMRLLPSISRIINHLQSLKHARAAVEVVTRALENSTTSNASEDRLLPSISFACLNAKSLSLSYGPDRVFNRLSFEIVKGDKVGVVGESGAGKSSLINILLGILDPIDGQVLINGNIPLSGVTKSWWAVIGYVPQESFLIDASLLENVLLQSNPTAEKREAAEDLLRGLGLPHHWLLGGRSIGENGSLLSGGQRQRVAIARALIRSPQVLVLDEATSAMDGKTQERVMKLVCREMRGKTILMISHRTEVVADCDYCLELPSGNRIEKS